uniref:Putative secreted protein n=1 Tax=Ixodes ricinus TaxID=34613 RepID=A0A6B0USC2_IXORI
MQGSMRIQITLGAFLCFFRTGGIRATDTATRRTGDRKSASPSDRVISRAAHTYTGYSCRRTRINRPRDGEPRSLSVAATAVAAATTAVQHYTEPTAKNDHVSSSPRSPAITTRITEITRRKAKKIPGFQTTTA